MKSKGQGSLRITFLKMTILPLMGLGLVITIFSSRTFTKSMQQEAESGLRNLSIAMLNTYDVTYPGDYTLQRAGNALAIRKGESIISSDYHIIDAIKEETGIDITLFYEDTRVLTTITNESGKRIVGTAAHPMILKEVLRGEQEHFYDNAVINNEEYFAYYMPVYNKNKVCVGMMAAAKPAKNIRKMINKSVYLIVGLALFTMLITSLVSVRFTEKMISVIRELEHFLGGVAAGNLNASLHPQLIKREDELGEMGRSTIHMQKAIRDLIERDALTRLYNRGSGERKMDEIYKKAQKTGQPFAVSIGDIDFFKKINDTYGHEGGDAVLRNIAKILNQSMQGKGFVARWGGEEFLLVYDNATLKIAAEALEDILNRIRSTEIIYNGQKIKITMTYGVVAGDCSKDVQVLLKEADDKLYAGKENGRNRVVE